MLGVIDRDEHVCSVLERARSRKVGDRTEAAVQMREILVRDSSSGTTGAVVFEMLCSLCFDPERSVRLASVLQLRFCAFPVVASENLLPLLSKTRYPISVNARSTYGDIDLDKIDPRSAADALSLNSVGALLYVLEDEFSDVREAAVVTIVGLASSDNVIASAVLSKLIHMVCDEVESVRVSALVGVAKFTDMRPREEDCRTFWSLLGEKKANIRRAVFQALGNIVGFPSASVLGRTIREIANRLSSLPDDELEPALRCIDLFCNHLENAVMISSTALDLLGRSGPFLVPDPPIDSLYHIALLVSCYSAAKTVPSVLLSLPSYALRYFAYVSARFPFLYPNLRLNRILKSWRSSSPQRLGSSSLVDLHGLFESLSEARGWGALSDCAEVFGRLEGASDAAKWGSGACAAISSMWRIRKATEERQVPQSLVDDLRAESIRLENLFVRVGSEGALFVREMLLFSIVAEFSIIEEFQGREVLIRSFLFTQSLNADDTVVSEFLSRFGTCEEAREWCARYHLTVRPIPVDNPLDLDRISWRHATVTSPSSGRENPMPVTASVPFQIAIHCVLFNISLDDSISNVGVEIVHPDGCRFFVSPSPRDFTVSADDIVLRTKAVCSLSRWTDSGHLVIVPVWKRIEQSSVILIALSEPCLFHVFPKQVGNRCK